MPRGRISLCFERSATLQRVCALAEHFVNCFCYSPVPSSQARKTQNKSSLVANSHSLAGAYVDIEIHIPQRIQRMYEPFEIPLVFFIYPLSLEAPSQAFAKSISVPRRKTGQTLRNLLCLPPPHLFSPRACSLFTSGGIVVQQTPPPCTWISGGVSSPKKKLTPPLPCVSTYM